MNEMETGSKTYTGRLIPLKTTLEVGTSDRLFDVYVTTIPFQQASNALNIVRRLIPNDAGLDLQHLRRFCKPAIVPAHVRDAISATKPSVSDAASGIAQEELFLLVGSVESISKEALIQSMPPEHTPTSIIITQVPLLAPTSQEQATRWTETYWPSVYKKSNPFGPHPSLVSRAEEEFVQEVPRWMALASSAARETQAAGTGEGVGVVVVRRREGIATPIAIAGDMRWFNWPRSTNGNATAHASMRAIAMVAEGLRRREGDERATPEAGIFVDEPRGEVEQCCDNYADEEGYLCHDLEIYCTHEPCVMCSMAIVHSRFGRVVFGTRMPRTGGLCADGELGHGLFWRKELNWNMLAWQWSVEGEESRTVKGEEDLNA